MCKSIRNFQNLIKEFPKIDKEAISKEEFSNLMKQVSEVISFKKISKFKFKLKFKKKLLVFQVVQIHFHWHYLQKNG